MQSQAERDEKTVVITTTVVLFVLTLAVGGAAGWAVNSAFDVGQGLNTALAVTVWCAAGVIPVGYLLRARR